MLNLKRKQVQALHENKMLDLLAKDITLPRSFLDQIMTIYLKEDQMYVFSP